MSLNFFRARLAFAALLALPAATPAQDLAPEDAARRIADIVALAVAEYELGVSDGRIMRLEEVQEARLFLDDARRSAERLPASVRTLTRQAIERLIAGVAALDDPGALRLEVDSLRAHLERGLGIALDPMPQNPPSLARGAVLYERACAQCHGALGRGDGPAAPGLDPPPGDLTASALREVAPVEFFRKVNVGVAGTAMPAFGAQMSLDDRWAVALHASALRWRGAPRERGQALLARCPECLTVVSDFALTAGATDDSLRALVATMTGVADSVALDALVAYARVAAAAEELGGDRVLGVTRTVARVREAVERAAALGRAGQMERAAQAALDAYLVFEGIESGLRARDPGTAIRVERAFAELRAAFNDPARRDVNAARSEVESALDAVVAGASGGGAPGLLFGQSLVIILREGLEAILIIGALTTFLVKAGAPERRRDIGKGVGLALLASLVTALGFATVFRAAVAQREVVEGVTMLVAAAVLFWVSYWLVSKIEVQKWQSFVRERMRAALGSGRRWALAGVAFLAVYREGFETVLFYAALVANADGSMPALAGIGGGLAAGGAVLAALYVAMQRYSVRIPLKPFFAATSALLYVMAFSFAGQGVAELQEVGWIGVTPLDWFPALPALGLFPTMQTALSQLVFAVALLAALAWVFWLEPRVARARA
jgi:high-affinity iron transporter